MIDSIPLIREMLDSFIPVGLKEIEKVRLMNRVDTKYVLSIDKIHDFLTRLNGGYRVLEINGKKLFSYSTTYLDTDDYLFFNQHVTGKVERSKVRYRKYESTDTTYLEVKRRTQKNRTIKWRIKNNLTSDNLCDDNAHEFINEYVPQKSLVLKPVLLNRFNRVTIVGSEFNERITIDYNISFSDPAGNKADFPFLAIIEVKREGFTNRSHVGNILKEINVHQNGFSKYCLGTSILHDVPRKNILKQKILLLNKIEDEFNRNHDV
jgi:hypothetical protein